MSSALNKTIIDDINNGTNVEAFLIFRWVVDRASNFPNLDPAAIVRQTKEKLLEANASPEAAAWISHFNFTRKISRKFGDIAMYDRELTNVESSIEALALYPDGDFKEIHLETIRDSLSKKAGDTVSEEVIDSYVEKTLEKLDKLKQNVKK